MLERRTDCHAIVQQMSAARGAAERAMIAVIVGSLADCLRSTDGDMDDANIASIAIQTVPPSFSNEAADGTAREH